MVKVGDKVTRKTEFGVEFDKDTPRGHAPKITMHGTVIYVNYKHFYHVVEFLLPNGKKYREGFKGL